MAAVWGALSSLFIGLGDLCAGRVSRRMSAVTLTATAMIGGVVVSALGLLVVESEASLEALLLGAAAGVSMAAALAFYIRGMTVASIGVVSPLAAVQVAMWPFVFDLVDGARPSGLAWVGVGVAMVSLVFTTMSPDAAGRLVDGVRNGLAAGALYGIGGIFLGITEEGSGIWPAVSHRVFGFATMAGLAIWKGRPVIPQPGGRALAFLAGAVGTLGLVAYVLGTQRESLGAVAVTGAMFPAVSAGLLYRFGDHPLRWWQGIGIIGAVAGIALIAVG